MLNRYSPRPWHLMYSVAMLAVASVAITFDGWFWFGVLTILIGFGSAVWIILSGYWESYGAYWEKLTRFAETMAKNRNPQLWAAMGFDPAPEMFRVVEDKRDQLGMGTTSVWDLPGSPQQFTVMCDGVLMGQPLSEAFWVGNKTYSAPTFRNVKKKLEEQQAIKLKIAGKPTQGYVLTRKGVAMFKEHCSAGIRQMLEENKFLVDPRPPSDKQLSA